MLKENLIIHLRSVVEVTNLSKLGRLTRNPFKYFYALYTRFVYYPLTKKGKLTSTQTFFGDRINLLLPAGTDIYLTGGKAHDSELRLALFLINRLKCEDIFIDVGAHFGFFSLLAAQIVGNKGQVFSFEGGKETYNLLHQNVKTKANIQSINKVVSNTQGEVFFYQFPSAYSEYNSLDIDQYENTDWIKDNPPQILTMQSVRLSSELENLSANIIKIDVEGGEMEVLKGLEEYLEIYNPVIIMEYLSSDRNNQSHILAVQFLIDKRYQPYYIDNYGSPLNCVDIERYMVSRKLDSDNIVFIRS